MKCKYEVEVTETEVTFRRGQLVKTIPRRDNWIKLIAQLFEENLRDQFER